MATQKAFASYQEIIDLHTESDCVTALGIHTPQGNTPREMFPGFFQQFKKFKYLGASLTLVPAARLPVDPLGVSYEAGEPTIDPRDILNPILWHGCHGNDMGSILNQLYGNPSDSNASDSLDLYDSQESTQAAAVGQLQRLYYHALTDNTWRKAHPQKGFKKTGLRPLVYDLATTRQIAPGSHDTYLGPAGEDGIGHDVLGAYSVDANGEIRMAGDPAGGAFVQNQFYSYVNRQSPQFITPRLTSLGWLDTRNVLLPPFNFQPSHGSSSPVGSPSVQTDIAVARESEVELPKIYMGMILLPPAYKTEQYFRLIVNHHFGFRGFRGASMDNSLVGWGSLPDNVVDLNALQNSNDNGGDDNGGDDVPTEYSLYSSSGNKYTIDGNVAYVSVYQAVTGQAISIYGYTNGTSTNFNGIVIIDGVYYPAYFTPNASYLYYLDKDRHKIRVSQSDFSSSEDLGLFDPWIENMPGLFEAFVSDNITFTEN